MEYDEIATHCESLGYRDKLRLSQLLIQLARKEEEIQNPQTRQNLKEKVTKQISDEPETDINSIQYVMDRLAKLRPSKKKSLLNSIGAMYQFQGAISVKDQEMIVAKLEQKKFLKVDSNNRVIYL
jgi:ParB-like chromosome segregation protein Spo0J